MAEAKILITAVDQTRLAIDSAKRNLAGLSAQASSLTALMGGLGLAVTTAFTGASLAGGLAVLDQLDALQERTGISVEKLSSLRVAAQLSDTSLEALAVGIKKLSTNMADALGGGKEAQAKFASLGITPEQLGRFKTADELLLVLADRFRTYEDGAKKNALATEFFGKRGEEMIGMLNRGSAGLKDMATEAQQLGVVFGGDLAKQASDFNDNLERIKLAAEGAKVGLLQEMLPALIRITNELIEGRKAFGGWLAFASEMAFKRNPFDSWSDSAKKAGDNVALLQAQIKQIESGQRSVSETGGGAAFVGPSGSNKSATNAIRLEALKKSLAEELKRQQYFDKLGFDNVKAEAARLENAFNGGTEKTEAPTITKAGSARAPDHFADNFINQLITEYANLSGTMSRTDEVTRKLDTATEKFTATQRTTIIGLAEQIDAEKRRIESAKNIAELTASQLDAEERLQDAHYAALATLEEMARKESFELGLLNQLPRAIDRARFARELDTKVRLAEAALVARGLQAGWDEIRMHEERAKILREASAAQSDFDKIQADSLDKERNPLRGMAEAAKDYLEELEKTGNAMKDTVTGVFKGMEDAAVDFFRTGKLSVSSFADSIVSDITRIIVKQKLIKPLAESIGGGFGGGFGGGGGGNFFTDFLGSLVGRATGGPVSAGGMYRVNEVGPELLNVAGKQYLMMGNQGGSVTPNGGEGRAGNSVSITVNQSFAPGTNRATTLQAAADARRQLEYSGRNL